ncbi:arylsulfatase [Pontiella sulfatireligans]|uniref:Arylsulfatase n=1 Tax=Pontiella sulfatireligans TaxID=2750658 RepID=A0A6C2UHF0_9BACT|nr:arylsulfatase [Pontiella sulfatireligans]SPS74267.1 sulfatase S1_17 [Kiritimatiellales bacterium]VGO18927.1 Arylsulfatase [Pontiella sulfatireligans]
MKTILGIVMATVLAAGVEAASLKGSRPNIVFVMTDDQGQNLSFCGHPDLRTPHIDKFAGKALRWKEFHVSPNCAPTRAALMSGAHEFGSGVTHTTDEKEMLALTTTIFPELLRQAGYETGIFGKWHLGDIEPYRPGNRGFTEALTHGAGGIGQNYGGSNVDFPPNQDRKTRYFDSVLLHNKSVVKTKGYCADVFFHAALAWMKEQHNEKKPFFAYISSNTPHAPLIAPKKNMKRLEERNGKANGRLAMIENIDDNFGIMMQKLEAWGMLDNTLVIFTTDNGAPFKGPLTPDSGKPSKKPKSIKTPEDCRLYNAGYKSGKGSPYEGGVHVPAFWQWKGVLPEGKDVKALTAHIDLYKTFCDLAGADYSKVGQKLEGRSLVPLLENPDAEWPDRMLITHTAGIGKDIDAARDRKWAVRTQRWRLVGKELYDIENDPFQDHNVAAEYPEIVERLSKVHADWWEDVVPLMINQNNTWDKEPPMVTLYNEQIKKTGTIPEWMPPEI